MTKFELVARIENTVGPTVGLWRANKTTLERLNHELDALNEYRTFNYDRDIDPICSTCGGDHDDVEHDAEWALNASDLAAQTAEGLATGEV